MCTNICQLKKNLPDRTLGLSIPVVPCTRSIRTEFPHYEIGVPHLTEYSYSAKNVQKRRILDAKNVYQYIANLERIR